MQNATAPNAGGGYKKIEARSKPGGAQKVLPSTAAHTQRALPSTKPLKALPAPPSMGGAGLVGGGKKAASTVSAPASTKRELPKVKPTYQPPSSTFSKPASQAGGGGYKPRTPAGNVASKKKDEALTPRTISSGKVVASPASRPNPAAPKAPAAPSLNLPPAAGGYTPNGGFKAPANKAGSVVGGGGAGKSFGGHIPGFDPSGKPSTKAPGTVVGGNKTSVKPPASTIGGGGGGTKKAGSIIQGGGPRFF
jgi:hypothetical protein